MVKILSKRVISCAFDLAISAVPGMDQLDTQARSACIAMVSKMLCHFK